MAILRNAKHEHFAHLVAKGETPPRAYVASGFSERGAAQSANRLLKNADVQARIAQLQKAIEEPSRERAIEKAAVDKAWVLNELIEVVKMGKAAEPVVDSKGEHTGEYKQNLAAANKALELIGKELNMFVDRKEIRTGSLDDLEHDDLKQLKEALDELKQSSEAFAGSSERFTH